KHRSACGCKYSAPLERVEVYSLDTSRPRTFGHRWNPAWCTNTLWTVQLPRQRGAVFQPDLANLPWILDLASAGIALAAWDAPPPWVGAVRNPHSVPDCDHGLPFVNDKPGRGVGVCQSISGMLWTAGCCGRTTRTDWDDLDAGNFSHCGRGWLWV